ncbi:MAG TPA: hypothetical protein VET65_14730 [Candidatus Limnocylindrales bacterium]|nr:hypothetical protein [Candidatus Limnocylindrales bacterium]
MRYVRAFGAFWYDFLVGDRPELFLGSIAVLVVAWIALRLGLTPVVAGPILTALVLLVGGLSLRRATRRKGQR